MGKNPGPTDILFEQFLIKANTLIDELEPSRVLRARVYSIGEANVLIRAALLGKNNRYFFGLNYITVEEIANLDNPIVAFICGSIERLVIMPAKILFEYLPSISHDRNGEYKINFDYGLNLLLKGRNNKTDCSDYVNAWHLIINPSKTLGSKSSVEESLHTILQGRLLEIGNIRGFQTFCPNKSKVFNGKNLGEVATLKTCPELQFSQYDILRQIDVLWFKERGQNYIPEYGFEVELSTGTWAGVGRLATLVDYANTHLFVVSTNEKKYFQVMRSFVELQPRYKHLHPDLLSDLYAAEIGLRNLRIEIGL